jgi:hypothetical protein
MHKSSEPLLFYATAATVLPVLYIAMVYQVRYFEGGYPALYKLLVIALYGAIIAVAEIVCFRVLANQEPSHDARSRVIGGLALVGVGLISPPILRMASELRDEYPNIKSGLVTGAVILANILVNVMAYLAATGSF